MRTLKVEIKCKSRGDKFIFIPIGDTHAGVEQFDEAKLKELVAWIKEKKNCLAWIKGDMIDAVIMQDIRYHQKNVDKDIDCDDILRSQEDKVCRILMPIKKQILWIEEGNHEKKVRLRYNTSPAKHIADKLGCPCLGTTNLIRINFRRSNGSIDHADVFSVHGYGTSNTAIARLQKMRSGVQFDIAVAGHVHDKKVEIKPYFYLNSRGQYKEKDVLYVLSGSFYDTYKEGADSYGEDAGYLPTKTGVVRIDIEPFRNTNHGKFGTEEVPARIHASL